MRNRAKRPAQSRTLRFNALVAVLSVLEEQTGLVRSVLTPGAYLWLLVTVALINSVLRLKTSQPIQTGRPGKKDLTNGL
jgi:hypothetical protein